MVLICLLSEIPPRTVIPLVVLKHSPQTNRHHGPKCLNLIIETSVSVYH